MSNAVVVYKKRSRDLSALHRACERLGVSLMVVESEEEFRREIATGETFCIIVPFGGKQEGGDNAREFINMAWRVLQPEDADVKIIYSTEGETPERLPHNLDPWPVKANDNYSIRLGYDTQWKDTILQLEALKGRYSFSGHLAHGLQIEFAGHPHVAFPTEAEFLLRAAFKDMSRIIIEFPRQGFSGSIACIVQPFDKSSRRCKRVFVKIYPDQDKCDSELNNLLQYFERYFSTMHYPPIQHFRRYRGTAYSILVTELVESLNGKIVTFKQMVESPKYSPNEVKKFISNALSVMDSAWGRPKQERVPNLADVYLSKVLPDEPKARERRRKLESENRCNRWFGDIADGVPLEEQINKSLTASSLEGTQLRICHGDFHGDNLLVKSVGNTRMPYFIDFSHSGETHSIKDLVTLESDLIIRCLSAIKAIKLEAFFESLSFQQKSSKRSESIRVKKLWGVINTLRRSAIAVYKVSESEYEVAALLKTLEILSYGQLPPSQRQMATAYISYLCTKLRHP